MRVVRSPSDSVIVPVPAEPEAGDGGVTVVGVDPEDDITQGRKSQYRQSYQRVSRAGD